MLLAEQYLAEILEAIASDPDDGWDDLPGTDFTLDPVARLTDTPETQTTIFDSGSDLGTFDKMTSTPRERKTAQATLAGSTPGSPGNFQAAQAATMPSKKQGTEIRWFQQSNGKIDTARMTPIEKGVHFMKPSAATAYKAMQKAMKKDLGYGFAITDSYRTYDQQVALKAAKPTLAATPGKSNHGWGIALDINVNDPKVYNWLVKNGKRYGFEQPMSYEPWHWEYHGGYTGKQRPKGGAKEPRPKGTKTEPVDKLNRVTSTASLISAPTVFGSVLAEIQNPIQTHAKTRKADQDRPGLAFVPKKLRNIFIEAGEKYGIAPRLLAAMADHESGFDAKAVSSAGAQGVMQVMPLHGLDNPFNAKANIFKGAEIFASYLEAADGNIRKALAFYNAGPNAAAAVIAERMRLYSDPILDQFLGRNR